MNTRHLSFLAAALFVALTITPSSRARAEVFGDIYLGVAFTADGGYKLNGADVPTSLLCLQECSSAISPAGGLRVGYWFDRFSWLGLAGDLSSFRTAWGIESPIKTTALPISALVLFRLQLAKTEELPDGRFQPYIAVGPALMTTFSTLQRGSNNPLLSPTVGSLTSVSDTSFNVGLDGRLGARILASDFISFFLEYRYTRATPSWDFGAAGTPVTFETTLSTNQFNLGMGLHFR